MIQVLYLGPIEGLTAVREVLSHGYEVLGVPPIPEQVEPILPSINAVLDASMKLPFSAQLLEKAGKLRLVTTATTGSDHIDTAWLNSKGIPLLTLKGQTEVLRNLTPAAELSWLLLMASARKLRPALSHVNAGLWNREEFPGIMLKGRTLGLIGLGRIGGWMARYAQAFGMKVVAHDPYQKDWPDAVLSCSLEQILGCSDFISIHVHASEETKGLLGKAQFQKMKRGTILINTSRGSIVDEKALLEALESGTLGGYACDVLEGEPDIQKTVLWKYALTHDQVLITPHIGGFSPDALHTVLRFTAGRIRDYFQQNS